LPGTVKTKRGEITGDVWQRPHIGSNQKMKNKSRLATGRLKLLIRFGKALPVRRGQLLLSNNCPVL